MSVCGLTYCRQPKNRGIQVGHTALRCFSIPFPISSSLSCVRPTRQMRCAHYRPVKSGVEASVNTQSVEASVSRLSCWVSVGPSTRGDRVLFCPGSSDRERERESRTTGRGERSPLTCLFVKLHAGCCIQMSQCEEPGIGPLYSFVSIALQDALIYGVKRVTDEISCVHWLNM